MNSSITKAHLEVRHLEQIILDASQQTADALDQLAVSLGEGQSNDECPEFFLLMRAAQVIMRLDDTSLSRIAMVSRPTVGRWTRGVSSPHPLGRNALFESLIRMARSEAKQLRRSVKTLRADMSV